jgi:intermembrane space import and assembly protein 40
MQDCFRQYPDVYGAELEDDDEPQADAPAPSEIPPTAAELDASSHPDDKHSRAKDVNEQMKAETAQVGENPEGESLIPKAAHDTEDMNQISKA